MPGCRSFVSQPVADLFTVQAPSLRTNRAAATHCRGGTARGDLMGLKNAPHARPGMSTSAQTARRQPPI
jgi:hypothetical protein